MSFYRSNRNIQENYHSNTTNNETDPWEVVAAAVDEDLDDVVRRARTPLGAGGAILGGGGGLGVGNRRTRFSNHDSLND